MLGVFAEFETNLRKERQLEGIAAAKARGVYKGRLPTIDAGAVRRLAGQRPRRRRSVVLPARCRIALLIDLIDEAAPQIAGAGAGVIYPRRHGRCEVAGGDRVWVRRMGRVLLGRLPTAA